ncbi:MAG: 23S rRNA (uracil(1939)-C(5))-methyltransferase RlmD [Proteobacteria bacterium]|nr:23S rRNA (uracil(1939)-C(5))-methyltransferase RlmD [Pseudomonadota bacterium]MBU4471145.1 23S rRNA (uracil(1939)-C(5))-methyltransferase RlmD [Pseudomonadota bacterium]MCG2750268.1 23S rRNA (uracil(1939)-C(5))-methyltransferase RlmD [Desulfobacteraceae bacterium]
MILKKGENIELEITDMAIGGRGIARVDGLVVFVDFAMPGDRVLARITKKKKSHAEAVVVSVLESSAFRLSPPCEVFGFCGGCKWQFVQYEKQLEYKRQFVRDAMEHIALLKDVPVHPTLATSSVYGYRNKMEFSCSDSRWLLPSQLGQEDIEKDFALGLHVPGTFHKVIKIDTCLLQPDLGNEILRYGAEFMKHSPKPVYGLKSHEGFWRFLMLRHSVYHDQWMVNIITSSEDRAAVLPLAQSLQTRFPQIVSVMNNVTGRKAAIAVGEYEICLAGDKVIKDRIGDFEFKVSANSFFQTNSLGAETLYKVAKQYAGLTGKETVLDLYCGTGTISIFLSDSAATVTGLEIVESAVEDAVNNCVQNHVSNCRFILGDIRESLKSMDQKPDVLIIDPPRVGMHKDVVQQILDMGPDRIVYVSCNPATQARDLALMKEDYRVEEIQPVDMFPHTFHVEAVARLVRKA